MVKEFAAIRKAATHKSHNTFYLRVCVCVRYACVYIYMCVCVCMNFILYTCMKHLEKSQCFTFPGICMKYDGVKGGK